MPPERPGTPEAGDVVEPVALRCTTCGHWEKGDRTKEQIAEWLRVHRAATLSAYDGDMELASICPRPCGGTPEMRHLRDVETAARKVCARFEGVDKDAMSPTLRGFIENLAEVLGDYHERGHEDG